MTSEGDGVTAACTPSACSVLYDPDPLNLHGEGREKEFDSNA